MSSVSGYGQKPLSVFKTEKEALNFAKESKGSELIIKEKNGSFSVHRITDELALKVDSKKFTLKSIEPKAVSFSMSTESKGIKSNIDIFRGKAGSKEYVFDSKKTVKDCFDMIERYPNVKIPGFSGIIPKGVNKEFDPGSFYTVMGESGAPDINGGGGKYEKIVGAKLKDGTSYVSRLKDNILNSKKEGNLTPKDILKLALDATGGDYGLASLAAHNLLKNLTYKGRLEGISSLSKDEIKIIAKLGNLRKSVSNDKMGPWYHFFGAQAAYTITNRPSVVKSLINWEHTIRSEASQEIRNNVGSALNVVYENGFKPAISPGDIEKGKVDYASCDLADKIFSKYSDFLGKTDNFCAKIELGTLGIVGGAVNWTVGTSMKGYRLILEQAGIIKK